MNKKENKVSLEGKKTTGKEFDEKVCPKDAPSTSVKISEDNAKIKNNITYGQRKQVRWVGFLRNLLDNPTKQKLFSVIQREVLETCTKRNAIPRRRVKFCNFVKHIYGRTKIIPLEISSSLFDKIKREFSKTHSNTRIDLDDPVPIEDNDDDENPEQTKHTKKHRKIKNPKFRRRKSKTSSNDGNKQEQNHELTQDIKKQKKFKNPKIRSRESDTSSKDGNEQGQNLETTQDTRKQKEMKGLEIRKRKSNASSEDGNDHQQNTELTQDIEKQKKINYCLKAKKRKSNTSLKDGNEQEQNLEITQDTEKQKMTKGSENKKRKLNTSSKDGNEQKQTNVDNVSNAVVAKKVKTSSFKFIKKKGIKRQEKKIKKK